MIGYARCSPYTRSNSSWSSRQQTVPAGSTRGSRLCAVISLEQPYGLGCGRTACDMVRAQVNKGSPRVFQKLGHSREVVSH